MSKARLTLNILAVAIFTLTVASMAQAQATRTWVSGVGDDVNPCSRTAPCKTFAGAISKTFINGEIDALDPGGYGTVTITKSITLDGGTGSGWASILASGSPAGVNINLTSNTTDDPTRVVRLRNLSINGTGASGTVGTRTGTNGVRIINATNNPNAVFIENCVIAAFSNRAISEEATSGKLFVTNTITRDNGGNAITILPTTGGSTVKAVLDGVSSTGNVLSGLFVGAGSTATVRNSNISGNANAGVQVDGAGTTCMIQSSTLSNNAIGLFAGANASITRIHDVVINNNGTGISISGGAVESSGNNTIRGNTGGNPPFGAGFTTPGQS
jgi:hypothetical protein